MKFQYDHAKNRSENLRNLIKGYINFIASSMTTRNWPACSKGENEASHTARHTTQFEDM